MLKLLNECLRTVRETIQLVHDIGKMRRGFIKGQLLERAEASETRSDTT